jgi:hypothetical protein
MVEATRISAKHQGALGRPFGTERPDLAARFVVRAAILAPSINNTQPWRFVERPQGLELWADRARLLPIADPAGRELLISCGASLFNARLAVRRLGFTPQVRLLPDPAEPDLLARVTWGTRRAPRPYEELLYRTIPHRHTHRGRFLATPLPPMLPTVLAGIARTRVRGSVSSRTKGSAGSSPSTSRPPRWSSSATPAFSVSGWPGRFRPTAGDATVSRSAPAPSRPTDWSSPRETSPLERHGDPGTLRAVRTPIRRPPPPPWEWWRC